MTEIDKIREQLREQFRKENGEIYAEIYAQWLESKLAALILETSKNKTNAQTNTPKFILA